MQQQQQQQQQVELQDVKEDPMLISTALDLRVTQQQQQQLQETQPQERQEVVERRCAEVRGMVSVKWDVTRKNKASIVIDGYKMTESRSGKDGRVFWRCSKRFCPATAISVGQKLLSVRRVTAGHFHSHPPAGQDEYFSADYLGSGTPTEVAVKWPLTPRRLGSEACDASRTLLKKKTGKKRPRHSSIGGGDEQQQLDLEATEATTVEEATDRPIDGIDDDMLEDAEDDEDVIVDSDEDEVAAPSSVVIGGGDGLLNAASSDPLDSPAAYSTMPPPPPPPPPPLMQPPAAPHGPQPLNQSAPLPSPRSMLAAAGLGGFAVGGGGGGGVPGFSSPEFLALLSATMASGGMASLPLHLQPPPAIRGSAGIYASPSGMPPPLQPPPTPQQPQSLSRQSTPIAASSLSGSSGVDNALLMRHLRQLDAYFRAGINGISNVVCAGVASSPTPDDGEFLQQLFRYMDGLSRVQRLASRLS